MILLEDKTNVDPPSMDYPFGKIRDDVVGTPGTPVSDQVYGDSHQFFAKMFDDSGIASNNLPDNATNGFQLYDAFQAVIANGLPGVAAGAWIISATPTVMADTGSVSIFSMNYCRYKIIGKTLFWQIRGGLSVNSGSPTMVKVSYPTSFTMPGYNSASPHKFRGFYKAGETICTMVADGVEMRITPSGTFTDTAQYFSFECVFEID